MDRKNNINIGTGVNIRTINELFQCFAFKNHKNEDTLFIKCISHIVLLGFSHKHIICFRYPMLTLYHAK